MKIKKAIWIFRKFNNIEMPSISEIYYHGALEANGIETLYLDEKILVDDSQKLIDIVKENKIDALFHVARINMPFEIFDEIRKYVRIFVLMHDDNWRWETFSQHWINHCDYILTTERKAVQKYKNIGFNNAIYRRWAFNDKTMPFGFSLSNYFNVSHCGGLHANRQELLKEFQNKGMSVKVFSGLKKYEDFTNVCAASKFSLSFSANSLNNEREAKGRWAEIPGFFTIMVTEIGPHLEEYWEFDKEIIVFDTVDEAIDKIKYLDTHDLEYKLMIERAHERLMKDHLIKNQFKTILTDLGYLW